jgi:hypothetical protein
MSISSSSQKAVLPFLSFIFQIRPLPTVFSRRPGDPHARGMLERLTPALVLSKEETQKVLVSSFNFSYCCWILFSSCSLVLLLWWRCASKPLKYGFTRSCPEPFQLDFGRLLSNSSTFHQTTCSSAAALKVIFSAWPRLLFDCRWTISCDFTNPEITNADRNQQESLA